MHRLPHESFRPTEDYAASTREHRDRIFQGLDFITDPETGIKQRMQSWEVGAKSYIAYETLRPRIKRLLFAIPVHFGYKPPEITLYRATPMSETTVNETIYHYGDNRLHVAPYSELTEGDSTDEEIIASELADVEAHLATGGHVTKKDEDFFDFLAHLSSFADRNQD